MGESTKQILQSFKIGEMWLADVSALLCPARGRGVPFASVIENPKVPL